MAGAQTTSAIISQQSEVDPDVDARLRALLDRTVRRRGIAHALFGITSGDGSRHWAGAAGPADAAGTPLRPDTPFFVASITKRFITTLVLQASERHELGLDDRITDHLPAEVTHRLHVIDDVDHTPDITIRHLLSHTSGLPDYWDKPRTGGPSLFRDLAAGNDRGWTFDDVIGMTRDEHQPHFPPQDLAAPRQRARYSDTGFQLLIRIVERASGAPYPDVLHDRIFVPLGLHTTWLPGHDEPQGAAPAALFVRQRALELPRLLASANDLVSTAADLLTFHRALLDGELFDHPETTALLTERSNLLRNMIPNRYGLGTWTFRVNRLIGPGRRPVTLIGHAGATGTWLFHCPELDVHLTGTIDQATFSARSAPFRIMARMLRAWHDAG